MKIGKFIGYVLSCSLLCTLSMTCVSRRVIIWNNDTCSRYIAFRDSVAQLPLEEKELNEERLQMLRYACKYSKEGLPVPERYNPYHTPSF